MATVRIRVVLPPPLGPFTSKSLHEVSKKTLFLVQLVIRGLKAFCMYRHGSLLFITIVGLKA